MKMKKVVALMLMAGMMANSFAMPAFAYNNPQKTTDVTEEEIAAAQVSLEIAKEGIVLLENKNNVLPIAAQGDVALFGTGTIITTKGGTGSGAVNNRIAYADGTVIDGSGVSTTILDGFVNAGYNVLTKDYLEQTAEIAANDAMPNDPVIADLLTDEELAAMAEKTDTAFYTVRRNAGEGADRTVDDYYLSESELANIEKLSETFDKVVVLLNVINCDASWFEEADVDGLVLVSNPGELGGDAIVSVLNGETNPSGKLVDTWAKSYEAWPSSKYFSNINPDDPWGSEVEFYYEDVFVGYRYFDTFNADAIQYDFGYGLSYTTFDIDVTDVQADAQNISVTVDVANTGSVAGKEVVQIYFSAPEGRILKPYQELIAYAKTDEIAPGESQTMTISFQTAEMSSYFEEDAAYIMEAGDYILRVGNSSRNTVPAAVITLDEDAVTEQLANKMSIDRYGVYPSGSNNAYDLTQEENVEQWQELYEEFLEENKEGRSLEEVSAETSGETSDEAAPAQENLSAAQLYLQAITASDTSQAQNTSSDTASEEAPLALSLSAADFVTKNPYAEKGVDPASEDVVAYVSATTDQEAIGEYGYNCALGKEYKIDRVEYTAEDGSLIDYRVKSGSEEDGTAEYYTLIDVQKGTLTLDQFVSGLSAVEMANIVEGGEGVQFQMQYGTVDDPELADVNDYIQAEAVNGQAGQTVGLYRYSREIPSMTNADGPAGVRLEQHYTNNDGEDCYQYCTAFPVGTMLAQTWNTDLAYQMGVSVGKEMVRYGVTQWLAPSLNIHRNPLCGRNFEYYSEDPLVSGLVGGFETLGVQENPGVGVTLKHFAGNNQENSRESQNDVATERAFREIYLKQFEIAVKISNPMGIMTSYGLINGTPTANDWELLEDLLRTEWGFDGIVMTDWHGSGGMTDAMAMHAGNEMIMPGNLGATAIVPYITDVAPEIELDESGIAVDGGYPTTEPLSRVFGGGAFVWRDLRTNWGDYRPDPNGADFTVVTTEEAFTTSVRTVMGENEFVDKTVEELVTEMQEQGTASFVKNEDGTVAITYKLVQASANDNTNYASAYKDHAITVGVNALGQEDYNPLSLADLQKAAKRVLTVAMRSLQWQEVLDEYAAASGEDMSEYAVGSYTDAVGDTDTYVTVTK